MTSTSQGHSNEAFQPEIKTREGHDEDGQSNFEGSENGDKKASSYAIDFNVVMKEIGSMGRYQILLVLLAYWVAIPCGINQVASVFLSPIPDYRCALPPLDNKTLFQNLTEEDLRNYTLPIDSKTETYDQCKRYNYNLTACATGILDDCITPYPPTSSIAIIKCDQGYWYDTSVYTNVVTTEWNLVCDDLIIGTTVTAIYFVGILISSLIGGNLADIFGRCPTMLVGQIGMIVFGIACSFAPNLVGFAALRFCLALFLQAVFISCFVYVVEIVGEKWRTFVGINVQTIFAFGYMALSGFAYALRDWRYLQFAISFVPVPFLLFWWFLPESPSWLFTRGQVDKAKRISEIMAKRNGNQLSSDVWTRAEKAGEALKQTSQSSSSPLTLFKLPRMRLITFNIMFNWFVVSLVYYGLSLNAGSLAGDDFLNNTLNGLVEIAAYALIILTMDRLGRRPLLAGSHMVGGIALLISTVINVYAGNNQDMINAVTALALIGKFAISGAFSIVYNYTAELYPTTVRSTAVGVGSMAARVGSIITPYTIQLQYTIPWLTNTIFGVLAVVAGLTTFAFPETLGIKMMTSVEEAESFYKGNKPAESEDGNSDTVSESQHSNEHINHSFDEEPSSKL